MKQTDSQFRVRIEKAQKLYISRNLKDLSNYFSEGSSEDMKLQWEIISSKFNGDISYLLSLLGFDKEGIEKTTEKYTGKKRGHHDEVPVGTKETFQDTFSFVELSGLDAEDFFNKAGAKREEIKQQVETRKSEPDFMRTISETISKV